MKYRFYVNVEQDEKGRLVCFMDGYQPGHALQLAYQGELLEQCVRQGQSDKTVRLWHCETLFRIFNIEHPVDYRNRSMSVGDVVVLEEVGALWAYACMPVGFAEIPVPVQLAATTHEATH